MPYADHFIEFSDWELPDFIINAEYVNTVECERIKIRNLQEEIDKGKTFKELNNEANQGKIIWR